MIPYKKVLFPVDLLAVSPKLVEHVKCLVERFSATLHVLYVVRSFEPSHETDFIPLSLISQYEASLREVQETITGNLQEFVTKNFGAFPDVKPALASGHTAREILKYIQDNGIDLVVMGTHGYRNLEKIFFGSVAQRVVQASPVPVMTFNPYLETGT